MRNAFADELTRLAEVDPRVVMLSGDIGNRLFDKFRAAHPDRFYNCGVAEQNMTGVAAGMALTGMRPITYTITPFVTTRCLEQIRTDVCYHEAPVIIVAVGKVRSISALVAVVLPWTISATSPGLMPVCTSAPSTLSTSRCLVPRTLAVRVSPFSSFTAKRSVKVPPTSIPIRQDIAPMLAVYANQVKGNAAHAEASGATVTSTLCTLVLSPMSDLRPGFSTFTFPCPGSCLGQRPL